MRQNSFRKRNQLLKQKQYGYKNNSLKIRLAYKLRTHQLYKVNKNI